MKNAEQLEVHVYRIGNSQNGLAGFTKDGSTIE